MNKALLDTDIFSEVLKGHDASVRQSAEAYRDVHGRFTVSVITLMELVQGFQRLGRFDRLQWLLDNLDGQEVIPFDHDAAVLAGRIAGDLNRPGQPIGRADPMVAAIALRHGLVLVTGNTKHFGRVAALGYDLALQDWRT
jgi:predicted nucleic acid-binding protein